MGKLVRASQRIIAIILILARTPFYFMAYFISYLAHFVGILLLAVIVFCGLSDYRTKELAMIWSFMVAVWIVSFIGLYITWFLLPRKPEFWEWYDYTTHNPIRVPIMLYKFLTAEFNEEENENEYDELQH